MHVPTPPFRFCLLNALAWSAYALLSVFITHQFIGASSGAVLISLSLATALWLVSGLLRARALHQQWWEDRVPLLLAKLAAGVAIGASLAQLAVAATLLPALHFGWVTLPAGNADYRPASVMVYWLNTAIALSLWTGVWASLHSLRQARHAELARLRAEAQRSTLERDALRARLNPHFVFNALNNLRALILEDPERAREMVTRLSRTLRHALDHGDAVRVRLDDELDVVRDYLAIESVHYEDRLRVVMDVAPDCAGAQLPAMALQLLVENAIKHGIAVIPGGGALYISARLHAGVLHLEVQNPLGIAAENAVETTGHGIGLAYLRAQLEGSSGQFSLQRHGERMHAVLEVVQ